jgi:hypothetical protein
MPKIVAGSFSIVGNEKTFGGVPPDNMSNEQILKEILKLQQQLTKAKKIGDSDKVKSLQHQINDLEKKLNSPGKFGSPVPLLSKSPVPLLSKSPVPLLSKSPFQNLLSGLSNLVQTKPMLIPQNIYQNIGPQINLVGFNPQSLAQDNIDKPISPRLLNWVEPYTIAGYTKTLFYTEVNSGLKVGDRVFIIGGNYDSDALIKQNKYRRGRDGYKVLFCDKCQIVLDIDFTGVLPYNTNTDDDYIGVYTLNTEDDFRWAEKSFSTRGGSFSRKFNYYRNNIVFAKQNFGPVSIWGNTTKISEAPGFFVRNVEDTLGIDNSLDIGFGFTASNNSEVKSLFYDSTLNTLLVGGNFEYYNGQIANYFINLNIDGTKNLTFNYLGFNGSVNDIKKQGANYLIAGSFSSYGGSLSTSRIVRLTPTGSIDGTFVGGGLISSGEVRTITITTGGKIVIGGDFSGGIRMLNSNGSIDAIFSTNIGTGFDASVNKIIEQTSTGDLIIVGEFTDGNGTTRNKVAKVSSTGVFDTAFDANVGGGFIGKVNDAVFTNPSRVVIVGDFEYFDGQPFTRIIALDPNGFIDNTFQSGEGFNGEVKSIELRTDGKLFIGGNFSSYSEQVANNLIRLNSDGTLDTTFSSGFGLPTGSSVVKVHRSSTSNNVVYVGGDFSKYNTIQTNCLVKLGITKWTNITYDVINGSFSYALSPTFSSLGAIKIFNDSFTYSIGGEVVDFKEYEGYQWGQSEEPNAIQGSFSTWIIDIKSYRPVISKGNFRSGNFNGLWNVGLYGKPNKKIVWNSPSATWNTGTLLNSIWGQGHIKSIFTQPESWHAEFDQFGLPSQKLIAPNNNGRYYNFLIDSNIISAIIDNGTIINTILGSGTATFSVIENSVSGNVLQTPVQVQSAFFEGSKIVNTQLNNAELKNVRAYNSQFNNIKSINSWFKKSYIQNSEYLSNEIIKINGCDEFNISEFLGGSGTSHKVYKFYISEKSYKRMKLNDAFYIKGLKVNDGTTNLINFFDKRFKVGHWNQYLDSFYDTTSSGFPNSPSLYPSGNVGVDSFYKRGVDAASFLSTPADNEYTFNSILESGGVTYSTKTIYQNPKKGYSLDIVISTKDNDFNLVSDINFDRSSDSYQAFSTYSVTFNYLSSGATYQETIEPSGFYNNRPWYELTQNATSLQPYSYVFWNNSLNKWEHFQNFSPVFGGLTFSQYYATLDNTAYLPETGTYSWQTQLSSSSYINSSVKNLILATLSQALGSNIDITNAYIIDSDFESGLIDTTDWSSQYSISSNADSNITIPSVEGGYYNLQIFTATSTIEATTTRNSNFREREEDYWKVNDIVWLNSIEHDATGQIESISIALPGTGYTDGVFGLLGGSGKDAQVSITQTLGQIIAATISNAGVGYLAGEILQVSGGVLGSIQILSTTGSSTKLPETYKIVNVSNNIITLEEIWATQSVLAGLHPNARHYTKGAKNRFGHLHSTKISNSFIKGGFLERIYLYRNLIENNEIDLGDKDFLNSLKFKNLVTSDILYTNNKNILSKASYVKSQFTSGDDEWIDGLFYNSVWNSGTFSKGLIKESSWLDGVFKSGTFYQSRTFNASPTINSQYYDVENIRSYWKSGITTATVSNNRYSWRGGTFSNGEFVKSDWESGNFVKGQFYNSKWYSGTFSSGTIGQLQLALTDTWFYNGLIKTAVVNNANLFAKDTSYFGLSTSNILWKIGTFNAGAFGCDIITQPTSYHTAIWETGTFNNGEFQTNGKWLDGVFNGGKFISGFGWTHSPSITQLSTSQSQFGWETGIFNDGEFGTADRATNSTWWSGEFNGGKFQARLWNDGIFTKGIFLGGSTYSAVGGYDVDDMSYSNANDFMLSFTTDFWGIFKTGIVTDAKAQYILDKKLFSKIVRSTAPAAPINLSIFSNMLWLGGIFSHPGGNMLNSLWLDGHFIRGRFANSAFNPYVSKQGPLSAKLFNLNGDLVQYTPGLTFSDTVFQDGFVALTFSQMHGFNVGDIITIDKDNKSINIEYDGTASIISLSSSQTIVTDIPWGQNSVLESGTITKVIEYLYEPTCVWYDGTFENGDFYISEWHGGRFNSGTAFGMIWKNGTSNYMNAYNVFWEEGIWRNGNWFGSFIKVDENGDVGNDFHRQLLLRGMNWSATSSSHLWNVFESGQSYYEQMGPVIATQSAQSFTTPIIPPLILIQ